MIVVGAGLVGLALARELQRHAFRVRVLDAGPAGQGASWAGAGMLAGSQSSHPALRRLGEAAARLYPTWVAELERETGRDCGYRTGGTLVLAAAGADLSDVVDGGWEALTPERAVALEPGLRAGDGQVWRLAHDHSVDNRALTAALVASVRARGIELREDAPVEAIEAASGGLRVRAGGSLYEAATVVNAAGAWAGAIPAPVPLPVRPRKGQMIALSARAGLNHVIEAPDVYLVPRRNHRVLVGATLEDVGFDATVSDEHSRDLHRRAAVWVPALAAAPIVEAWAGFRPGSSDDLPILGPTACPGYWAATGHFRDGILLAPITAKIISSALLKGHLTTALDLTPFLPRRFDAEAPAAD